MENNLKKEDRLFHATHGLCRVTTVNPASEDNPLSYTLLPVIAGYGNIKFTVPEKALEDSGFYKLISEPEANAILDYLKTGGKSPDTAGQSWMRALIIREAAARTDLMKDWKKNQALERSVRNLTREIAFVLNIPIREAVQKILQRLGSPSKINPILMSLFNLEARG